MSAVPVSVAGEGRPRRRAFLGKADAAPARARVLSGALFAVFETVCKIAVVRGFVLMAERTPTGIDPVSQVCLAMTVVGTLLFLGFLLLAVARDWNRVHHGLEIAEGRESAFRKPREDLVEVGLLEFRINVLRERWNRDIAVFCSAIATDLPLLVMEFRWLFFSHAFFNVEFVKCICDHREPPARCVRESGIIWLLLTGSLFVFTLKIVTLRDISVTRGVDRELQRKLRQSTRMERSFLAKLKPGEVTEEELEVALELVDRWPALFLHEDMLQRSELRALWIVRRAGRQALRRVVLASLLSASREQGFPVRADILKHNRCEADLPGADPWARALGLGRIEAKAWRITNNVKGGGTEYTTSAAAVLPFTPDARACRAALAAPDAREKLAAFAHAIAEWTLLLAEDSTARTSRVMGVVLLVDAQDLPSPQQETLWQTIVDACGTSLPKAEAYPMPVRLILHRPPEGIEQKVNAIRKACPLFVDVKVTTSTKGLCRLVPQQLVPATFLRAPNHQSPAAPAPAAAVVPEDDVDANADDTARIGAQDAKEEPRKPQRAWSALNIKFASELSFFSEIDKAELSKVHRVLQSLQRATRKIAGNLKRGKSIDEVVRMLEKMRLKQNAVDVGIMVQDADEPHGNIAEQKCETDDVTLQLNIATLASKGYWPDEQPGWSFGPLTILRIVRAGNRDVLDSVDLLSARIDALDDDLLGLGASLVAGEIALCHLPSFAVLRSFCHVRIGIIDVARASVAVVLTDFRTDAASRLAATTAVQEPRVARAMSELCEFLACLVWHLSCKHRRVFRVRVVHRATSLFDLEARRARARVQRAFCRGLALYPGLAFAVPVLFVNETQLFLESYRAVYRLPQILLNHGGATASSASARTAKSVTGALVSAAALLPVRAVSTTDDNGGAVALEFFSAGLGAFDHWRDLNSLPVTSLLEWKPSAKILRVRAARRRSTLLGGKSLKFSSRSSRRSAKERSVQRVLSIEPDAAKPMTRVPQTSSALIKQQLPEH